MVRLGVNIDHVATLRQAREEEYPSLVDAARICLANGADQITIHLREDRRHIQDTDLQVIRLVTQEFGRPLNLEMGCAAEIIGAAISVAPDWVCLVPENREEKTTEGGLNLSSNDIFQKVEQTIKFLRKSLVNVKISLFLESNNTILEKAVLLEPDAVEIHTGDYARSFLANEDLNHYWDLFFAAKKMLKENSIACHAGHGLTYESTVPLLQQNIFEEYNIGHFVICQAIFDGLGSVVKKFKDKFLESGEVQ